MDNAWKTGLTGRSVIARVGGEMKEGRSEGEGTRGRGMEEWRWEWEEGADCGPVGDGWSCIRFSSM